MIVPWATVPWPSIQAAGSMMTTDSWGPSAQATLIKQTAVHDMAGVSVGKGVTLRGLGVRSHC